MKRTELRFYFISFHFIVVAMNTPLGWGEGARVVQ